MDDANERIRARAAQLEGVSAAGLKAAVIAAAKEWRNQPDYHNWSDAVERLVAAVDALNRAERS